MMHLEYLDSFLAVAKAQSFSKAAESLYISQSSLTKRIQHLEDRLGHKLFDRTTKNVTLTNFGKLYFKYAAEIAELEAAFDSDVQTHGLHQQTLTFGTIPSSSAYKIADLISAFIKQTNTNCKISSNRSGNLETMLNDGNCDFAFIKNVDSKYDFKVVPFNDDHLVAVLSKNID